MAKSKRSKKKLTAESFASLLKEVFFENETPNLNPAQELTTLGIKSPLIIVGEEAFRIRRLVEWIKKNCFIKHGFDSFLNYYGSEISNIKKATNIANSFSSLSLFSSLEVVVIKQADKVKAANAKPLIEALKKTHPSCFVILLGEKINTQTPLLNNLTSSGTVVEVGKLDDRKLKRWIQNEAKASGATGGVSEKVLRLLTESYGNDLLSLSQQITKLSLLADDSGKITEESANEIIFQSPERTSFELLASLSSRNLQKTIARTNELLQQGLHPLQLSSFLGRSYRAMLALKSESNPSALGKDLVNPWFAKKLKSNANSYKESELHQIVQRLISLDEELKSSSIQPNTQILNTLTHIIHCKKLPQ